MPVITYSAQYLLNKGNIKCEAQRAYSQWQTPQTNPLVSDAVGVAKYTQPMTTIYNAYFTAHSKYSREGEGQWSAKSM